jgi:hypothetical protein
MKVYEAPSSDVHVHVSRSAAGRHEVEELDDVEDGSAFHRFAANDLRYAVEVALSWTSTCTWHEHVHDPNKEVVV